MSWSRYILPDASCNQKTHNATPQTVEMTTGLISQVCPTPETITAR